MRVKIAGLVTPERLIQALERAALTFEGAYGDEFDGFYGANLYLQAYTKDGRPVAVSANGGKEIVIDLRLPTGAPAKPMPSDDVLAERKASAIREEQQRKESEARSEKLFEEHRARMARRDQAEAEQARREAAFQAIVAQFGEVVVRDCNAAIQAIWEEVLPVWPHGQKKGLPRAMPYLVFSGGAVFLHAGNRPGDGFRIKTPLSRRCSYSSNGLEPHWKSPEWKEGAVPMLAEVIEKYVRKLPKSTSFSAVGED